MRNMVSKMAGLLWAPELYVKICLNLFYRCAVGDEAVTVGNCRLDYRDMTQSSGLQFNIRNTLKSL